MTVKILVADDSVTVRKIFELTFAAEDVELNLVDSGDAAIEAAGSADLIFADASMATDGYAVAQASGKPVVILASQQTPYDAAKGEASGVIDHVLKPFDSQAVIDKAAQHAGATPKKPAAAAAPAAPKPPAPAVPRPPAPAAPPAPVAAPPKAAPAPRPAAAPVAAAVSAGTSDLAARLSGLNLSEEQINGVLGISREVIEQVVWEVVPDLAETIIREEIRRLTA